MTVVEIPLLRGQTVRFGGNLEKVGIFEQVGFLVFCNLTNRLGCATLK
jgi:hypothetical protein